MKFKNKITLTVMITLSLFLSACATIFSDSADKISFTSDPSGAELYLNGDHIGKTPVSITLERQFAKTMVVVVKKKGYKTKEFMLRNSLATAAIFNLTSGFSWTTDALTGNMLEYDPKKYLITLEPGTGNAMNDLQYLQQRKALTYVALSFNQLKRDIANGQGEYLTTLVDIMPEHNKTEVGFIREVSVNKQRLIESQTPVQLYDKLVELSNS